MRGEQTMAHESGPHRLLAIDQLSSRPRLPGAASSVIKATCGSDAQLGSLLACGRRRYFHNQGSPHRGRRGAGRSTGEVLLGSVRYQLSKLRAKGLVEKLPHSRRYRLLPNGYRICLVFLKLFAKIYAPLTAGLLHPYRGDRLLLAERLSQLDRLYQAVVTAVDNLATAVGLKLAA